MSEHTPGPWFVSEEPGGEFPISNPSFCIEAEGYGTIAEIGGGEMPIRKANAQLIAAAPELLAACEDMVAWFADPGRGLYDARPEVYLAGSKPIVSRARKAIQKARSAP